MITTYENPKLWQRTWFLVVVLVGAAIGAGIWWWQTHGSTPDAGPTLHIAARPAMPRTAIVEAAILAAPKVMDDGRPTDFSPEDWSALKEAMAKTPNPRAELERVVKYLRFQKGFEQWQSLQDGPDVLARRKLAEKLLEQLPERLKQAEVTYGEALLLQEALMKDIYPDLSPELFKERMKEAEARFADAAPKAEPDLRLPEYKRREAAIVAAYQALPEAKRDPAQLSRDLDAARIAVYGRNK